MNNLETDHERARFARENAGLSVTQAAKLAELRAEWLTRFERGEASATSDAIGRMADIYRVSRNWLLFNEKRTLSEPEKAMIKRLPANEQQKLAVILESLPGEGPKPKAPLASIISGD